MVAIDYTISVGSIAEVITLLGGGLVAVGVMRSTVNNIQAKVDDMETELKGLTKALMQLAVQHERINHLEEDIREMKRGDGFVGVEIKRLPRREPDD